MKNSKKLILSLIVLVMVCASAFATSFEFIINVKPQLSYGHNVAAVVDADKKTLYSPSLWWRTQQDYFTDAANRDSFMDLGFNWDIKDVNFTVIFDLKQDMVSYLDDSIALSNFPFAGGTALDFNFPRVAYIDYETANGNFYFSLGRRQIKWGASTYNMAISNNAPHYDSFYASANDNFGTGLNFKYDYTIIAFPQDLSSPIDAKTFFAHRFTLTGESIRFSIAEINNVYGKVPSLFDASPLAFWHDNYQDNFSNVMLDIEVEAVNGPFRVFGQVTVDDFDLPAELQGNGWSNKPTAIGIIAGAEMNFDLDTVPCTQKEKFDYEDYALKDDTFKKTTGLTIGYELNYCSPFMYNRSSDEGKFTVPYKNFSFITRQCNSESAFMLGFKYGSDTLVNRLYADYYNGKHEGHVGLDLVKRGSYTIDSEYGDSDYYVANNLKKLGLVDPVTFTAILELEYDYQLQEGFVINTGLDLECDFTNGKTAYEASVGASIDVNDTNWRALFRK